MLFPRNILHVFVWVTLLSTCHGQLDLIEDLSCDVFSDACEFQFDSECDAGSFCPAGSDCFDCDACQAYSTDCQGCLQRGCYWCPGDATCFNSNGYIFPGRSTSCNAPEDYILARLFNDESISFDDLCQVPPSSTTGPNFFSDPLYSAQRWVYDAIGIEEVWKKGYTGRGVQVRINDNGMDADHAEFSGRFQLEASCANNYLPKKYETSAETIDHGTVVAGIVGAAANNGVCSVGIAPEVLLSSCDFFAQASGDTPASELPTFFLDPDQVDLYDIAQTSIGDTTCQARQTLRRKQRKLQQESCPFQRVSSSPVPFPCESCSAADLRSLNDEVEAPLSQQCESSIIQHCRVNYEQDRMGCMEVLDLLVKDGKCKYITLTTAEIEGLVKGIGNGRNGKGIIYVFSAGNENLLGGEANTQSYLSSRFSIGVGATGKDGVHSSYSNTGANLMLVAPGGDFDSISTHVTAAVGSNKCNRDNPGTSFSSPVVTGVIALMLEANPDLTWRDVQAILASTSLPITNAPQDTTAGFNKAGFWHSNFYGFGLLQAGPAVEAAETWVPLSPERQLFEESGDLFLPIVDDDTASIEHSIFVESGSPSFVTESVAILVHVEHFSRGHLEIALTSPQGTRSILHPGRIPENTQLDYEEGARWKFLTRKNWGESPNGSWKLEITDLKAGDVEDDCITTNWLLFLNDGSSFTCQELEDDGLCFEGEFDPFDQLTPDTRESIREYTYRGQKVTEACCACGGIGNKRSDVTDQLVQWTMIVYGHQETTDAPSGTPSGAPSDAPFIAVVPSTIPSVAPSTPEVQETTPPVDNSLSPSKFQLSPLWVAAALFCCLFMQF